MKLGLRPLIIRLAGNDVIQRLLAWNVYISQYLMGIGSGSTAGASGEGAVVALAARRYTEGPLCLSDVGANQGQYLTGALKALTKPEFIVHAVEPSRAAFVALREALGTRAHVHINNSALGSAPGSAT